MIAEAEHKNQVINSRGTTADIMQAIVDCYNSDYAQVEDLACNMPGSDVKSVCKSIFDFVDQNIRYKMDPFQKQWIRTPARLWADREGDCKSFAIFICSCLRCCGIPHLFRFACYEGNEEPTHVYAVALDEAGNEVIVDPVYRDESGKAIFNEECPYTKKIDMKGTTEISRLSGTPAVGYFPETEIVAIPDKENLPRGEQDILIALNNLNTLYIGSKSAEDSKFTNQIENLMDLASVAILLYESSENSVVNIDCALPCLLALYESGAFNQPEGTTNEQRSQMMNINLGAVVKESANYEPDTTALTSLIEILSISTPGFDPEKYLPISTSTLQKAKARSLSANRQATQAEINSAQKTLFESAEYFMYSFIPEAKLDEYPDSVRNKRAYYTSVYQDIKESGCFSEKECLRIINNAIYSRYGCDGEVFLYRVKKGEIPIIEGGWLAILGTILTALGTLASLFSAVFETPEEETNKKMKENAPTKSDGFAGILNSASGIITPPSIDTGSDSNDDTLLDITTPTGTVAGSNYLGIILVGGVLLALLLGGSGDKKKKRKK